MTVVFDAESLLAFSFDEPGAGEVERWLDRVYDGEITGYVPTINLVEFRYIAVRKTSAERANAHINDLREMGLTDYTVDGLWKAASDLKAAYSPSLADAYAVATAKELDDANERNVTLLAGADDDYDVFEETDGYEHLIERYRDDPA